MSILNDTTPRLTRHLSDHHAVQGEAEYVERHAPVADLCASGQVRSLEWEQVDPTAVLGHGIEPCQYYIRYEVGSWWMPGDAEVEDAQEFDDLEAAKAAAQADYERRILAALTPAPQAEGQVRANDDACEALARAYDREDAAQRGETDPWSIGVEDEHEWVADRIACARAGLAALTSSPGWQPIETISRAAQDVLAERQRQISVEGWDDTHDDCNDKSELAQAAACYALSGTPADEAVFIHGRWKDPRDLFWPWTWDRSWWKPTNRRRDLVKAGALILAEIERLDRAAPEAEGASDERE